MDAEGGERDSAALQEAYRKRIADAQARAQAEAQVSMVMRQVLDPAAYGRLSNIKLSSPDVYSKLVQMIAYLYQNGQIKGKLSEEQLKQLVGKILSTRRETTIRRI